MEKKRKRKADSEDISGADSKSKIADKVQQIMSEAVEKDDESLLKKQPATRKLEVLDFVAAQLRTVAYSEYFIDINIFKEVCPAASILLTSKAAVRSTN